MKDGGNSFVGIVHASELVPYDSAVFISTAAIPPHTELVQDAAITLLKKRIRVSKRAKYFVFDFLFNFKFNIYLKFYVESL